MKDSLISFYNFLVVNGKISQDKLLEAEYIVNSYLALSKPNRIIFMGADVGFGSDSEALAVIKGENLPVTVMVVDDKKGLPDSLRNTERSILDTAPKLSDLAKIECYEPIKTGQELRRERRKNKRKK